jgi:hypothetical protein
MKGTRVAITARDHPHWGQAGWRLENEKLGTGQRVVLLDDGTRCGVMPHEMIEL